MQEPGKKAPPIVLLAFIAGIIVGGGGMYLFQSINKLENSDTSDAANMNNVGNNKPVTQVKIGTKEVSKGAFQKVEGGTIYYKDGADTFTLPLTKTQIAINCTDQSLAEATVLDYTQIKKVEVYTPDTIVGKIPVGEPIVVFAAIVDKVLTAHTIALKTSSCPK